MTCLGTKTCRIATDCYSTTAAVAAALLDDGVMSTLCGSISCHGLSYRTSSHGRKVTSIHHYQGFEYKWSETGKLLNVSAYTDITDVSVTSAEATGRMPVLGSKM